MVQWLTTFCKLMSWLIFGVLFLRTRLFENLRMLPHAPGVQMTGNSYIHDFTIFFFYCRKLDLDIIGSIWRIVLFVFQPFQRMLWMMRVGRRKTKKIQTRGFQVSVYFVTFCYEIQRIDLQLSFINYTYVTAKIMKTRDKRNIMNIN